ncbi:hypothetical protein BLNAU_220 [Blattamonas nauphoetae]|uniref:Uncharacterized protein n=1 Tax=Blattamonas nauphoetae TaxID=2049346 RepID=A0ABQ9YMD1_9EUKA|nr:hypothetical protein BLNAU_220 [Blattamonas nauphoetae]
MPLTLADIRKSVKRFLSTLPRPNVPENEKEEENMDENEQIEMINEEEKRNEDEESEEKDESDKDSLQSASSNKSSNRSKTSDSEDEEDEDDDKEQDQSSVKPEEEKETSDEQSPSPTPNEEQKPIEKGSKAASKVNTPSASRRSSTATPQPLSRKESVADSKPEEDKPSEEKKEESAPEEEKPVEEEKEGEKEEDKVGDLKEEEKEEKLAEDNVEKDQPEIPAPDSKQTETPKPEKEKKSQKKVESKPSSQEKKNDKTKKETKPKDDSSKKQKEEPAKKSKSDSAKQPKSKKPKKDDEDSNFERLKGGKGTDSSEDDQSDAEKDKKKGKDSKAPSRAPSQASLKPAEDEKKGKDSKTPSRNESQASLKPAEDEKKGKGSKTPSRNESQASLKPAEDEKKGKGSKTPSRNESQASLKPAEDEKKGKGSKTPSRNESQASLKPAEDEKKGKDSKTPSRNESQASLKPEPKEEKEESNPESKTAKQSPAATPAQSRRESVTSKASQNEKTSQKESRGPSRTQSKSSLEPEERAEDESSTSDEEKEESSKEQAETEDKNSSAEESAKEEEKHSNVTHDEEEEGSSTDNDSEKGEKEEEEQSKAVVEDENNSEKDEANDQVSTSPHTNLASEAGSVHSSSIPSISTRTPPPSSFPPASFPFPAFTFSIVPSTHSIMLSQLSSLTNGRSYYLQTREEIFDSMIDALFRRTTGVLRDVKVQMDVRLYNTQDPIPIDFCLNRVEFKSRKDEEEEEVPEQIELKEDGSQNSEDSESAHSENEKSSDSESETVQSAVSEVIVPISEKPVTKERTMSYSHPPRDHKQLRMSTTGPTPTNPGKTVKRTPQKVEEEKENELGNKLAQTEVPKRETKKKRSRAQTQVVFDEDATPPSFGKPREFTKEDKKKDEEKEKDKRKRPRSETTVSKVDMDQKENNFGTPKNRKKPDTKSSPKEEEKTTSPPQSARSTKSQPSVQEPHTPINILSKTAPVSKQRKRAQTQVKPDPTASPPSFEGTRRPISVQTVEPAEIETKEKKRSRAATTVSGGGVDKTGVTFTKKEVKEEEKQEDDLENPDKMDENAEADDERPEKGMESEHEESEEEEDQRVIHVESIHSGLCLRFIWKIGNLDEVKRIHAELVKKRKEERRKQEEEEENASDDDSKSTNSQTDDQNSSDDKDSQPAIKDATIPSLTAQAEDPFRTPITSRQPSLHASPLSHSVTKHSTSKSKRTEKSKKGEEQTEENPVSNDDEVSTFRSEADSVHPSDRPDEKESEIGQSGKSVSAHDSQQEGDGSIKQIPNPDDKELLVEVTISLAFTDVIDENRPKSIKQTFLVSLSQPNQLDQHTPFFAHFKKMYERHEEAQGLLNTELEEETVTGQEGGRMLMYLNEFWSIKNGTALLDDIHPIVYEETAHQLKESGVVPTQEEDADKQSQKDEHLDSSEHEDESEKQESDGEKDHSGEKEASEHSSKHSPQSTRPASAAVASPKLNSPSSQSQAKEEADEKTSTQPETNQVVQPEQTENQFPTTISNPSSEPHGADSPLSNRHSPSEPSYGFMDADELEEIESVKDEPALVQPQTESTPKRRPLLDLGQSCTVQLPSVMSDDRTLPSPSIFSLSLASTVWNGDVEETLEGLCMLERMLLKEYFYMRSAEIEQVTVIVPAERLSQHEHELEVERTKVGMQYEDLLVRLLIREEEERDQTALRELNAMAEKEELEKRLKSSQQFSFNQDKPLHVIVDNKKKKEKMKQPDELKDITEYYKQHKWEPSPIPSRAAFTRHPCLRITCIVITVLLVAILAITAVAAFASLFGGTQLTAQRQFVTSRRFNVSPTFKADELPNQVIFSASSTRKGGSSANGWRRGWNGESGTHLPESLLRNISDLIEPTTPRELDVPSRSAAPTETEVFVVKEDEVLMHTARINTLSVGTLTAHDDTNNTINVAGTLHVTDGTSSTTITGSQLTIQSDEEGSTPYFSVNSPSLFSNLHAQQISDPDGGILYFYPTIYIIHQRVTTRQIVLTNFSASNMKLEITGKYYTSGKTDSFTYNLYTTEDGTFTNRSQNAVPSILGVVVQYDTVEDVLRVKLNFTGAESTTIFAKFSLTSTELLSGEQFRVEPYIP